MSHLLVSHMRIRCPYHKDRIGDCVVSFQYEMVYCMTCGHIGSVGHAMAVAPTQTRRVLTELHEKWRADEAEQDALMMRHMRAVARLKGSK